MVITPLERGEGESTVLVNRGWISKQHRDQRTRRAGLPTGKVVVEGLLREPWKRNMFTPANRPEKGEFYFPDVHEMAALVGSQPVWIESTQGTDRPFHELRPICISLKTDNVSAEPEYMKMMEYEARGIPFGRAAEVNLRNNHAQYIFTW